jgi:hypothetical protein
VVERRVQILRCGGEDFSALTDSLSISWAKDGKRRQEVVAKAISVH